MDLFHLCHYLLCYLRFTIPLMLDKLTHHLLTF